MISVKTNSWYFWMALSHISATSIGCHNSCNRSTLHTSVGSAVLLSCSFGSIYMDMSPEDGWVVWSQVSDLSSSLVNFTSPGQVDFLDTRQGRVKAFLNQGYQGNFSIRIDSLQASDMGSYCCVKWGNDLCYQVDLEEREIGSTEAPLTDLQLQFFFIVGCLAFFIVLLSGCFCLVKWKQASAPTEDAVCPDSVRRDATQETGDGNVQTVYENNEHDPTIIQHDPTRNQHDPTRIQHDPTRNQHDPTRNQHDPTRIQQDPIRIQHAKNRIQHNPNRIQHNPTRIQHDPTRIQHDPTRNQRDPTRIQNDSTSIQHDPNRIQHDPTSIQHDPTRNQHGPARHNRTPVRDLSDERQGFHRELMSRLRQSLRQSSIGRRYYVNQAEINQRVSADMDIRQKANDTKTNQEDRSQMDTHHRERFWGKRSRNKCEYENPIYNNRVDHLNKL
ncbi:hypothetical protein UPYG_G00199920 [Umbra pygmaea]|uniref:Ig-like domain-containing protein n=1 Tax=Umbra pygmaea TaxID=75934 RepID=A0ABD0WI01_UMBPY